MWEWLKSVFSFRRRLREREEAISNLAHAVVYLAERVAEQDGAISTLSHALVYATTPTPEPDEPGLTEPVRLRRKSYLEIQREFEFEHNMLLRRIADKKKYGML